MGLSFSCCGDQVPSKEVINEYGRWSQPREDVAEAATKCFSAHHEASSVLGTKTIDLGEFGEGHTLYFFFLKWFSCMFFTLFIITGLPSMLFNLGGGYYQVWDILAVLLSFMSIAIERNFSVHKISVGFPTSWWSMDSESILMYAFRKSLLKLLVWGM